MGPSTRYEALIFDLDGTLVDSYEPIAESLNRVRESFGLLPKSLEEIRREVGRGLDCLIGDNIGTDRTDEGVRIFRAHYRKVFRAGTRLMPGVAPTLGELSRRGLPMAVTSNKPAYFSREILDGLGLAGLFRAVLGPEMVSRPKPDPEMVHLALASLGREAAETLYVGDMRIDIETCRRASVAVCVVPSGSESRESLIDGRPDHMIERFEDLLGLLEAPEKGPVSSRC